MSPQTSEELFCHVDGDLLSTLKELAQAEGQSLQLLVNEALTDLIDKRMSNKPRAHVMDIYQQSHDKFAPLYQKLAQ